jgi:AraC-like DNA-binding protein
VAFPAQVLSELQSRYFTSTAPPWDTGSGKKVDGLNPFDLGRIHEIGATLARVPPTRLHLDRMLIEVFAGVEAPAGIELPSWLREALSEWQRSPDAMAAGVGGLAALAGRSREHVSRVVRQATGQRTIDVLNRLRLDTAAAQLRMTDRPIALIAIDVGLTNLSNFYRIFGATFGTTPRRYRLRHHQVIDPKP